MHGLIRVRQFTISEGHLMCTPEQLADEFKSCLELTTFILKLSVFMRMFPTVSHSGIPMIQKNISVQLNSGMKLRV